MASAVDKVKAQGVGAGLIAAFGGGFTVRETANGLAVVPDAVMARNIRAQVMSIITSPPGAVTVSPWGVVWPYLLAGAGAIGLAYFLGNTFSKKGSK